jgi:hypothetical protein
MLVKSVVKGKVMKKERTKNGNLFVQVYDGDKLLTVFDGKNKNAGLLDDIAVDDDVEILVNAIADNMFLQVAADF